MKKVLYAICAFVFIFATAVSAQNVSYPISYRKSAVFSPALFSGLWNAGNVKTTGGGSQPAVVSRPSYRNITVLRYSEGATELTEEQRTQLVPLLKRISNRTTKHLETVGSSKTPGEAGVRITKLIDFLTANNHSGHSFSHTPKIVPIDAIIPSNNNTIKIVETN